MNGDLLMQLHHTAMSGPEFLDAVADQEAANGNDVNAGVWRDRALQWKQDQLVRQQAEAELQHARDQLADIRRTLQVAA